LGVKETASLLLLAIMGIQNFYSIFDVLSVNSIPIFRSGEQKKVVSVDHLLVDLNNCLYLFTSPGRENFVIQNVCHFIDRLLSIFQPKKAVFLALDGPGLCFFIINKITRF
jgi:5'-3' exonuclease